MFRDYLLKCQVFYRFYLFTYSCTIDNSISEKFLLEHRVSNGHVYSEDLFPMVKSVCLCILNGLHFNVPVSPGPWSIYKYIKANLLGS